MLGKVRAGGKSVDYAVYQLNIEGTAFWGWESSIPAC